MGGTEFCSTSIARLYYEMTDALNIDPYLQHALNYNV